MRYCWSPRVQRGRITHSSGSAGGQQPLPRGPQGNAEKGQPGVLTSYAAKLLLKFGEDREAELIPNKLTFWGRSTAQANWPTA